MGGGGGGLMTYFLNAPTLYLVFILLSCTSPEYLEEYLRGQRVPAPKLDYLAAALKRHALEIQWLSRSYSAAWAEA